MGSNGSRTGSAGAHDVPRLVCLYGASRAPFRWFLPANSKTLLLHRAPGASAGPMERCVPPRHVRGQSCFFKHRRRGLRFSQAPGRRFCVVLSNRSPAPPRCHAWQCIRGGTRSIIRVVLGLWKLARKVLGLLRYSRWDEFKSNLDLQNRG